MNEKHVLFFELTAVPKARPKFTKRGFAYTPKTTKQFECRIAELARSQYKYIPVENKPIRVSIIFIFPKPQKPKHPHWHVVRPDADNLIKGILDACNGILWEDDALICELFAQKKYTKEGMTPRIILTFETISGEQ